MSIFICLEKRLIENHFDVTYGLWHQIKEYHFTNIREVVGNRFNFLCIRQIEMKGLSHSVLSSQVLIKQELFTVILADDKVV